MKKMYMLLAAMFLLSQIADAVRLLNTLSSAENRITHFILYKRGLPVR